MANLYLVKLSPALFSHRYLNKLPIKSQALIKGYKSKQAKIQKIGSSLLIAHVLRKYKISESLLRIDKNGKPYVIGNEIHFNVSHSYNVLVCVTSNSVIGVDVEMTNPRLKMIKSMFLSTNEQKEYLHSSDSQLTQI
jgi:4'-phosphopantetheinyl transferase